MSYKKILTVQDISCVGQCSLTVALPILSACGLETCILPSAILSTHTAGFQGFTFRDLTEDFPAITRHWQKEGISFQAIYTGYLGSTRQIFMVRDMMETLGSPHCLRVVDPVMGDHGKLYPPFDSSYVEAMKELCASADILIPNITEACLLTGMDYRERYGEEYVEELVQKLALLCHGSVVLTGVSYEEGTTGVVTCRKGELSYYRHDKVDRVCHGTGDIFASTFTGAYLRGKSLETAAKIAADYTVRCILNTAEDPDHWYGSKFEPLLGDLIQMLKR